MSESIDTLARASAEPDLNFLTTEYQRAKNDGGMVTRLVEAENLRFCRWTSQTEDGLKHQRNQPARVEVSPWEGAFDTRQPVNDDVINGLTDLLTVSFWNARVRDDPVSGSRLSVVQCAEVRQMVGWLVKGALSDSLPNEVELAAQCMNTVGHAVVYTGWREEFALKKEKLDLQQILAMAQQAGPQAELFASQILDPAGEATAAAMLQQSFPHLKTSRAQRVVRELRESGIAEFPNRQQTRNLPEVLVLRPGDDVFVPPETTELPLARVIFRRQYLSPQQVEAQGTVAGWDEDFITQTASQTGPYSGMEQSTGYDTTSAWMAKNLCEIVYAYTQANDEDGVPGVYVTVFNPNLSGTYGRHDLLDYATGSPFIALRSEVASRRLLDSRGVPETFLKTGQNVVKAAVDATLDRALIELKPPVVRNGMAPTDTPLGPDARLTELIPGETRWMEPPRGNPQLMFNLLEWFRNQVDDHFGRLSENTPPSLSQMRQNRLVDRWLRGWSDVFKQALVLTYQYLSTEEIAAILGRPPQLTVQDIQSNRMLLKFDVRSLDSDWVNEMMKSIATYVLPNDAGGTVDRAKLMSWWMSYLDPTLAEEVLVDQGGAAQKVFKDVRDETVAIMAGNEPMLEDASNDPTGPMKLQFLQQIAQSNPRMLQAAQQDPQMQERFKKYSENLQQAAVQQQNKVNGRLGVKQ
jgi:hypothetical protein